MAALGVLPDGEPFPRRGDDSGPELARRDAASQLDLRHACQPSLRPVGARLQAPVRIRAHQGRRPARDGYRLRRCEPGDGRLVGRTREMALEQPRNRLRCPSRHADWRGCHPSRRGTAWHVRSSTVMSTVDLRDGVESLEYWRKRSRRLSWYRVRARREAKLMTRRWE